MAEIVNCAEIQLRLEKEAALLEALETLIRQYEWMSRAWHRVAKHGGEWENCDALCEAHRSAIAAARAVTEPQTQDD